MSHYKLVRDLIPSIIESRGEVADTMQLGKDLLVPALKGKLLEEANEVMDASQEQLTEELADVLEVILSIAHESGITMLDLENTRFKKRSERGGFEKGILLKC